MLAAALSDLREAVAADGGQLHEDDEYAESVDSDIDGDQLTRARVKSVVSEVSLDPSMWASIVNIDALKTGWRVLGYAMTFVRTSRPV